MKDGLNWLAVVGKSWKLVHVETGFQGSDWARYWSLTLIQFQAGLDKGPKFFCQQKLLVQQKILKLKSKWNWCTKVKGCKLLCINSFYPKLIWPLLWSIAMGCHASSLFTQRCLTFLSTFWDIKQCEWFQKAQTYGAMRSGQLAWKLVWGCCCCLHHCLKQTETRRIWTWYYFLEPNKVSNI